MSMQLGKFHFDAPVFLAPMAGVTDVSYRIIAHDMGCPLCYAEMVSCTGIHFHNQHTLAMLQSRPEERPLVMQLFANDPALAAEAAQYDQVFAEYRGNHRSIADFIRSDCLPFDCDNDHSDVETDWKTASDVEAAFPGVPFYLIYSRHHMEWKGKHSPRPRFHVIFPIDPVTDGSAYRRLKESVISLFPYFDTGAKDAARFFFGVRKPVVEQHGGETDAAE